MRERDYDKVCYLTEQHDENVAVWNIKTGEKGYSCGCTYEGKTIQVTLANGERDSWAIEECSRDEVRH